MHRINFPAVSRFVLLLLVFSYVLSIFAVDIWDPDFWWHLKTGQYIAQTKSLPEQDPFDYTSVPKDPIHPESKRIKFILTQYWLAQLIFFGTYQTFGFQGIGLLRAFILTMIIIVLYRSMRREGLGFALSLLTLVPAILVFKYFTGERPQLFSFFFSFFIVYLLEGFRKAAAENQDGQYSASRILKRKLLKYIVPIPFIMLFWANMHGGYVVGIIIIFLYCVSELAKYGFKKMGRPLPSIALKYLLVGSACAVLVSFLNPNGYDIFPFLMEFERSTYKDLVTEGKSLFYAFTIGKFSPEIVIFVILAIIGTISLLINIKRLDLTDVLLFSFFTVWASKTFRVIAFSAPILILFTARYLKIFMNQTGLVRFLQRIDTVKARLTVVKSSTAESVLCIAASLFLAYVLMTGNAFKPGVEYSRYPTGAVKFLKAHKIAGNMLNPYDWGGYLIWTLYPDYKVFVDGRGLIEEIVFQNINMIYPHHRFFLGMPEWKALFQAYHIDFFVGCSVGEFSGKLMPIVPKLVDDVEWHLVYFDNNSFIFVRDTPENADIIRKFDMPKEWVWNEVITEAERKMNFFKGDKLSFLMTIGDALAAKKDFQNAKSVYLQARDMAADNSPVKKSLNITIQNLNHH